MESGGKKQSVILDEGLSFCFSGLSSKWLFLCWPRLAVLHSIKPCGLKNLYQFPYFIDPGLRERQTRLSGTAEQEYRTVK